MERKERECKYRRNYSSNETVTETGRKKGRRVRKEAGGRVRNVRKDTRSAREKR